MTPIDPLVRGRAACDRPRPAAIRRLVSFTVSMLLAAALGHAQPGPTSSIAGVVTDPEGARVPRARLVLAAQPSGLVLTREADALGAYRFDSVPAGRYELRVWSDGFRADALQLVVRDGQPVEAPVRLHVSALTESVVVSAAQVELPLARAADSVSVITSRDLSTRQVETVADALRTVPGLTVARNGGRGGVTSLFPRGGDSDFTLVLVDGIKANAFGGGYDFSTLTTADVERIEVVRGPESALFGADAMGGVVQVVTRSGGRPRGGASLEAGSFDTRRMTASTAGSRGRWSWGAAVERVTSAGFTGIAPATGETVGNDDFRDTHGSAGAGWRAPGGADLRATMNLTSSDRGFPGPFGSNPIGAYTAVDRLSRGATTTKQYGGRWLQPVSGRVRLTATGSYVDLRSDFTSAFGLSASSSRRASLRAQSDVDLSSIASLSGGVEVQRERATSTFITADAGAPVPINRLVAGAFAELRLQPVGRLSLTAGVRAERIRRDRLDQSLDPYSPRPTFGVDARTSVNPRGSVAYFLPGAGSPWGWTRLHAAAGTGIRAPDALEIAFTDNPGLKPERSRSVEAGVDQALLGERLVLGATAFLNRYEDLIVAVGPAIRDASRYRTDNISNARARGLEVSAAVRVAGGLECRLGYTFLSTAILAVDRAGVAPAPFQVGDPLLRRPRHSAVADLTWTRGRLAAFGRLNAQARVLDVEPSYGTFGGLFYNRGFSVVDAGASWRILPAVELIGRVGNLLDRHYEETFGFPALGRNAMIGVRVAAGR
jgi:outer membrane cobalamin receptor